MYLKTVVLDGFKSYGRRTEITGFDKEFTAITGLNGTGKSNILDAICYAMGLSQLGQVRATSSQDLIYKSGQAGVTKASVTLIFDNSQNRIMGFEKCNEISVTRQVEINGKLVKNYINGKLVTFHKLQDFFGFVQLNVQNPSFLIMQGRITKVLNMKPQEILSMVEEAAGTSMYEKKRVISTQILEKKEHRVRETSVLLEEEVCPKLQKLRSDSEAYREYQNICRQIEFLERIHVSWRYKMHHKTISAIKANIDKVIGKITNHKQSIAENNAECERIDDECKSLQVAIDAQCGGDLKKVEEELQNHLNVEATASGKLKAQQGALTQEQKKKRALEQNIADDQKALQAKETEMVNMNERFANLKDADAADKIAFEEAQRKYDAVMQGLSTDEDGQSTTLQDQLIAAKTKMSEAQTAIKTKNLELRHSRTLLNQKKSQSQTSDAAYNKDKALCDKLAAELQQMSNQLSRCKYTEGSYEQLQEQRNALLMEGRKLNQKYESNCRFNYDLIYKDPEPNFNRSKVRGMVGKLFRVKNKDYCMALQIAAGGALFNQVVEDDVTSQKLVDKGQLQNRVTFIPMNKISCQEVNAEGLRIAKELVGNDNVHSALSLVEFDRCYDPVMKYVFARTFICRNLDVAKQVTYHPAILARCVTLDGDITNPDGSLSGGARTKEMNHLEILADLQILEKEMKQQKAQLNQLETSFPELELQAKAFNKLKETIELRQHDLTACKQRLAQTSFQQHQEEITNLEERIETLEQEIKLAQETQQTAQAKVKDIESKLADAKGYRERELKAASAAMKAAQTKADASHKLWKKHENRYDVLKLEIEELRKTIASGEEELAKLNATISQIEEESVELKQQHENATKLVTEAKQTIKQQKDKINSQNKELRNQLIKKEKLQKHNDDLSVEIKKLENETNKLKSDAIEIERKTESLEQKYAWIKEDYQYFGIQNTRYDYNKQNPKEAGQMLEEYLKKKEKMSRHVNMRAMMVLEREEETYQQTMRRRKIVEEDKEKIQNIICKMDDRKREQVETAWNTINENFSDIFSTLLNGAQARLHAVKQNNTLIGLEIKVGFNNVWKDSLGELSGGQRSLVALSLVLAMLKFSPAPLYILDEVDAALDMSHTQNIGNMMKKHFTGSQFIVVSLKEGMFNNANVLFRTRFEEGVSCVTRLVNSKKS